MAPDFVKVSQIAARKKAAIATGTGADAASGAGDTRLPVRLDFAAGSDDALAGWLEAYFAVEVTTAASSRRCTAAT